MVSGILHSNSHYYRRLYFTFLIMRGDPADPLTAARSLRDYRTLAVLTISTLALQLLMISVNPLLQHDSEVWTQLYCAEFTNSSRCIAPLNLPHIAACCGAVDTPAVVDGIRHFTQQFTLPQEIILYFLTMRGDHADQTPLPLCGAL